MTRLYHDSLYDRNTAIGSYWEASAPPLDRATPPLAADASCEVAVIGAGYTGLTAALSLVEEEGADVAVVEAGTPGWGASGRNGGFCCLGGAKLDYGAMVKRYGLAETRRFFQIQIESVDLVTGFCADKGIDADLTGSGEIILAHKPGRLAGLRAEQAQFRDLFGLDCPLLDRQALAARGLAAADFHGGLLIPPGVGLHPLKYLRGLARAAIDAGVKVYGQSPVTAVERRAGGFVLVTPQGLLKARKVIIATNGYSEEASLPALSGRLLPVLSNILVTRPLSPAEQAEQGWTDTTMCADSRRLLHYFRLLPDGRFLFGGRGAVSGSAAAAQRGLRRLRRDFEHHFPAWTGVETEYSWRGLVCLTQPLVPFVGALEEEGLYAALAYHGNGVSFTAYAGRALAGMVAGRQGAADLPAVLRAPLPRFPLAFLRKAYLAGAYGVYGLKDALG
ncbi:FAD-binding oxidoreductase [Pelagibius litoralis]|uniref:FAD-binding oxidoreductase n=1 Tax=Pelagibius litoralis TaxID=374515 RepID=A0A967C832_9PROT|nr:FAD-dependent oxidoreductase [Pelagibius litoralis]NIA68367.1 FAD-binding oxidoreductase [Pelagibius litoralis]